MVIISAEEYEQIQAARKANKNKRIENLLKVLCMRYEKKSIEEIARKTDFHVKYIPTVIRKYRQQGLEEFIRIKQTSHNRRMSEAQEAQVLKRMDLVAEKGQIITAADVKAELEKELGGKTSTAYVYRVMKRHGWRKVMPRSKHPKAASEEEQNSSKKLTFFTKN